MIKRDDYEDTINERAKRKSKKGMRVEEVHIALWPHNVPATDQTDLKHALKT